MTPGEFADHAGVSRETRKRLEQYWALVLEWQGKMSLVGPGTLEDPWRRHFLDSAQLGRLVPERAGCLVDLGTGAGFPGLVLAIMGMEDKKIPPIHLIESDQRKAGFLSTVIGAVGPTATVHVMRIEEASRNSDRFPASRVVVARALAPLDRLLDLAAPLLDSGSMGLFLKGRGIKDELTDARKRWKMVYREIASESDPSGVILAIEGLDRVGH